MNKVTIVVGSHRGCSQSLKIGRVIEEKLMRHGSCASVALIDLAKLELPFWKESYDDAENEAIQRTKEILTHSDAFVFVAPEWNGMVPSALKNLFLLYSTNEFGHKPALIAGISAGIGGTYPISEMRSTTYKNSRICYIPEHLIFRDVESLFNNKESDNKNAEAYMSDRADFALDYLLLYSDGMRSVRELAPEYGQFANGM